MIIIVWLLVTPYSTYVDNPQHFANLQACETVRMIKYDYEHRWKCVKVELVK